MAQSRPQPSRKLTFSHAFCKSRSRSYTEIKDVSLVQKGLSINRICHKAFLLLIALCITAATTVFAQSSGGDFELTRTTIDAGGGRAIGVDFELTGAIAQPEANVQQSSGGEFLLAGGFWASANDRVFADGFEGT